MAKFAFWVEAFGGWADVCIGFSWGRGGPENAAVYVASTFTGGIWAQMRTDHPVDIIGGFPGINGRRVFLDVMGSSLYKAYVEVDFKIYEPGGARPVFQIPTTSIQVFGLCTNGFSINTDIHRGGNVGNHSGRILLAGIMGLI